MELKRLLTCKRFYKCDIFRRHVTKKHWYTYLSKNDILKHSPYIKFIFKHDGDIWKLFVVNTKYLGGTYVERFFWNEKTCELEGEVTLPTDNSYVVKRYIDNAFDL